MPDAEQPQDKENVAATDGVKTEGAPSAQVPPPASTENFTSMPDDAGSGHEEKPPATAKAEEETPVLLTPSDPYAEKLAALSSQIDGLNAGIKEATEAKAAYTLLLQETVEIRDQAVSIKNEIDSLRNESLVRQGNMETEYAALLKIKSDLESDVDTVSKINVDLDNTLKATESKALEVETLHATIATNLTTSNTELASLQGTLAELKTLSDAAVANIADVTEKTASFNALAEAANTAHKDLVGQQASVSGKITEIESLYTNAQKHYSELFTDITDKDSGATVKASIKTEIENLNTQIKMQSQEIQNLFKATSADVDKIKGDFVSDRAEFSAKTSEQFAKLKADLEKEIHSLLPGAGAAGLASSFFDAKSRYAATPFREDPKRASTKFERAFHYTKSALLSLSFYILFVGPLLYVFFYLHSHLDPAVPGNNNITALNIILRVAYVSPLIVISIFGLSSINLYRRLYEEYNHKQRVMELYHSFKEELGGDENQKKELLEIMLKTVRDKPSLVMHHYENDLFKRMSQMVRKSYKKDNAGDPGASSSE